MHTHYLLPESTGLDIPLIVLLEQLRTIDKLRLERFMCRLDENTMKEIDKALAVSLGLHEKKDDTMLLSLCGTCLSDFHDIPEYAVRRENPEQDFKETCCVCGYRKGWDYVVRNLNDKG